MLLRTWLHGRQPNTAAAYAADARRFLAFAGKPLAAVTLADLQGWETGMTGSHATRTRRLAAVKSLLTFGARMGVLEHNAGVALKIQKAQSAAGERVLSQTDVTRLIAAEANPRLRALLRLLYVCGLRASELCALRWRDLSGTDRKGGEARILGKGGKLRVVVVPADLWRELAALASISTGLRCIGR
jgi:site-specific recombinase XerD